MAPHPKLREVGGAILIAAGVLLASSLAGNSTLLRGFETASLDLRFRVRGAMPADPAISLLLVDDRSLAALGRWPLSRRLYAAAIGKLKAAGAKVIVFDILFPESEPAIVSPALRTAAGAAASGQQLDDKTRATLRQLMDADPDRDLAAAIRDAGNVLLPVAFTFQGGDNGEPQAVSDSAYARFDNSAVEPAFPLRPT